MKKSQKFDLSDLSSDQRRLAHLLAGLEVKWQLLSLIMDRGPSEKTKNTLINKFFKNRPSIIETLSQIPEIKKNGGTGNLTIGGLCYLKKDDLRHFGMSDSDIKYLEKRLATKSLFLSK